MNSLTRRVIAGLSANAFGQAINVGIQLLSLPLFLHRWDLATYGTWLVLSAIPAYLSMADVGMVTVAGNEMTMAMGRGDVARANSAFQSILVLVLSICGGLTLLTVPVCLMLPLPGVTTLDERIGLLALALAVLVAFIGGLTDIVFKSTHRFATGVMLGNLTRLAEWGGGIAGLFLSGSFTAVALGALAARIAGTLAAVGLAQRDEGRHIRWGIDAARRGEVLLMVRPAVSFMAFPLSSALSLQGVTLLVGQLFGPAQVAVFNTYRTMARVAVQITSIFGISLWPEFSRLYGFGGAPALAPIYRRSAVWGACIALGLSVAMYPSASLLLRIWTHGMIGFEPAAVGLLLAYAAVAGAWYIPRVLLMSINLHGGLAQWALASSVTVLFASSVLGPILGLPGIGISMLLAELLVASACLLLAHRVMQGAAPSVVGVHP